MIPKELIKIKNWMYCNDKNNAPANVEGKICSYTDKTNWVEYNEKTKIFILDNNYTVIDFDMCLDENGNIYDWAKEFVSSFINQGFYIEYSRSKRGLHIFAKGSLPENISIKMKDVHQKYSNLHKKSGIEIFVKHAITVTRDVYKSNIPATIAGINENFNILYKHLLEMKQRNTKKINCYNNSNDLFNFVKSSISLNQVFAIYGIEYNTRKNISCPFPSHTDKKPSFSIDDGKDVFYCHAGCGGGTIIDFIMKMENLNNLEASKWLANKFNLDINIDEKLKKIKFVDNMDIFEKINNYLSEINKEDSIPFSENCFLPNNYSSGYYMVKQGFCKRYICKIKNELEEQEEIYVDKVLIPVKIYPTKIIFVDGSEEVEYNDKILCDNDSFSTVGKFKTWLKSLGKFLYFDGETKDLVHLEKYINTYKQFAGMQQINAVSKLGWTKDFNFNPYAGNELFIKNDQQFKNFSNNFTTSGSFEIWKKNIDKYSKNDVFRAIFNTSLASPLIELIRRPPIWIHNYEKANTGKTPAIYGAASIWAKPGNDAYTPVFSATRPGLEFMWHTLGNLPCILDDAQNLHKSIKDDLNGVIYDMFNGAGKIRGTITGKNHDIKNWKIAMITNGEQALLQGTEYEGAVKRILEIKGVPINSTLEARKARDIFQDNYGHYGEEYIKTIIKHKEDIKDLCMSVEDEINNDLNIETHIQSISTLIVCDYIFNVYCLGNDKQISIDNAIQWGKRILKQLPLKDSIDKTTIALSKINEFVLSNTHRFKQDCPQGRIGFFQSGIVYFFPEELKTLLNKWDIPIDRFYKDIKEKEIVLLDEQNRFKTKFYGNRTIRPIAFNNIDIDNLIENIDDYK